MTRAQSSRRRWKCCAVVFSKDRPLQLHATLETLKRNVHGIDAKDVFVILKASDETVERCYKRVKHDFREFQFWRERDFKKDLLTIVANPYYTHVLFSVDDNVFVERIDLDQIARLMDSDLGAIGFSLRLGTNISFCHTLNRKQKLRDFRAVDGDCIVWNWGAEEHDFGYPLEVSSSVYRTSLLKQLCQSLAYVNPNTLEHQLDLQKSKCGKDLPRLMSYRTSRAFCMPMNLTQQQYKNRHSKDEKYTVRALLQRFARGEKMNTAVLESRARPNSPHCEIPFAFVPRNQKKKKRKSESSPPAKTV